MAKRISVAVYDQNGVKAEKKVNLNGDVFGIEPNTQVMFDAVQVYQANMRQATAKTKTRAEVRGGGKKPWRQKGTGRARAGSNRSPIWVGGGTVFGPSGNQNYKLSMNKKSHELAVKSALSVKAAEKNIVLLDSLNVEKTKDFVAVLAALEVAGKALIVLSEENEVVMKAARNVPGVKVVLTDNVCVYDVLNAEKLIFTVDAAKKVEGGLK
jgi:large subunit ribosomal protein L4